MKKERATMQEKRREYDGYVLSMVRSFVALHVSNGSTEAARKDLISVCFGKDLRNKKFAGKDNKKWTHNEAFAEVIEYPVNFGFNHLALPMHLYLDNFEDIEGELTVSKDKLSLLALVIDLLIVINENKSIILEKKLLTNKFNNIALKNRFPLNTKLNSVDAKKALYLILDLCSDKISIAQFLDEFNPYLVRL